MRSKSKTRILKAVSGAIAGFMLVIFILFAFQIINPWIFWISAGCSAAFAFLILPRTRKSS